MITVPGRLSSAAPSCSNSVAFGPWRRGGSRFPSIGGLRFFGFRAKVWWRAFRWWRRRLPSIKSSQLHLDRDVEKLVGVV
jgi:hypothetical protein